MSKQEKEKIEEFIEELQEDLAECKKCVVADKKLQKKGNDLSYVLGKPARFWMHSVHVAYAIVSLFARAEAFLISPVCL